MLRVFADDVKPPFTPHDFTVFADLFHRSPYLHITLLPLQRLPGASVARRPIFADFFTEAPTFIIT